MTVFPNSGSGRETFATMGPAGLDYSTTGAGRHTGAEAVGAFTFEIAWLKSTFAHCSLPRGKSHAGHGE